jgi:hypothetical protein
MGSRNARDINKLNMCPKDGVDPGSFWGRSGDLWDHSGCQEVCFLIGYKNVEVPERVDSQNSTKIAKVRKL